MLHDKSEASSRLIAASLLMMGLALDTFETFFRKTSASFYRFTQQYGLMSAGWVAKKLGFIGGILMSLNDAWESLKNFNEGNYEVAGWYAASAAVALVLGVWGAPLLASPA